MSDYADLFSKSEQDPLLQELNGNVIWRYGPMDPNDTRPMVASMAPFVAVARIKKLEHELQWEKESREVAAEKSWKFSDRIRKLETALREIAALGFWDGDSAMGIACKVLEGKKDE